MNRQPTSKSMTLKEQIIGKVEEIIYNDFDAADVNYIPNIEDGRLTFGNTGLRFDATVLYIDMRGSTEILNRHRRATVAKIHMAYFHTIVKIAKKLGGEIRSFNGDSMLVFFYGTSQEVIDNTVKTAMQMKYMITSSNSGINYILSEYSAIDFGIGIDCGTILCTKVGIGGKYDNKDLMWVGNAVNKATVLSDESKSPYHIRISEAIYDKLGIDLRLGDKKNNWGQMDTVRVWKDSTIIYNGYTETCYYTNWHIPIV